MDKVAAWQAESRSVQAPGDVFDESLMTSIGLIEGEILTFLEERGATPLRRLIRELGWAAPMVMMAVGALVRQGLIRALKHELEVVLELRPMERTAEDDKWDDRIPGTCGS